MSADPRPSSGCCDLTRRGFLRGLTLGGLAVTFGSTVVTTGPAYGAPADHVLVVLSLRGAADGLSLVVPHGDPAYAAARPTIAVPAARLLAPDPFFGLHPSLAPLLPMWNAGQVAAVHATGMAVPNRSHFAAMEIVEDAAPGSSVRSGWLNRMLGSTDPLQGLAIGSLPSALAGTSPVMSLSSIDDSTLAGADAAGTPTAGDRAASLRSMWSGDTSPLGVAMTSTLTALDELGPARSQPATTYPSGDLGAALSSVARTLRADVGVSVATVDHGGWDMHVDLGTLDWGAMIRNAGELASCVAAFFNDLGAVRDRVTLVTISEFGRRVVENSSRGLDHGWGNVMLVMGAGVNGGYYARWTPLQTTLDADLAVTTDYRDVLSEVLAARAPSVSLAQVFPGFTRTPIGFMAGQSGWGQTSRPAPLPPGPTPGPTPAPSPAPGHGTPPASAGPTPPHKRRRRRRHRRKRHGAARG